MGAEPPDGSPIGPSYVVPAPPAYAGQSSGTNPFAKTFDYRLQQWDVRNQGLRGTCVAHALVAARECSVNGGIFCAPGLSEQFLFWAAKRKGGDKLPMADGTRIEYAVNALASDGVCEAPTWPYDPSVLPDVAHHDLPSPPKPDPYAIAQATKYRVKPRQYAPFTNIGGHAPMLMNLLQTYKRPAAISVAVFKDPVTGVTNWNLQTAQLYGTVEPPMFGSVYAGGHAVCVVGYVSNNAGGLLDGYFLFRNSWGQNFATHAALVPDDTPPPFEQGYGALSAAYVDRYLFEACVV